MKRKQYDTPNYQGYYGMGSLICKKPIINDGEEDRISKLSDDIIHRIFSFLNTRLAVQTSILSKRWKFIWTTLPYLNFDFPVGDFPKFIYNVLWCRNSNSNILKLELSVGGLAPCWLNCFLHYAIHHNVEDLKVYVNDCDLSIFKTNLLKKLVLRVGSRWNVISDWDSRLNESDCWDLPALTSLRLENTKDCSCELPMSCLICLPALKNLHLRNFDLRSFSLPALTTLYLRHCKLHQTDWVLPSLISLTLDEVEISSKNPSELFSALVSLRNLTWLCDYKPIKDCSISCPQLVYLKIMTPTAAADIVVIAPKLRDVNIAGIVSISCGVSELENVNIKFFGSFPDKTNRPREKVKLEYYKGLMFMFLGLGKAKILTLDLDTLKALFAISDHLKCSSSPFSNLKYVKLPHGYEELGSPETIKNYFVGGSQGATIVTALPQNDVNPQIAPVPPTLQHIDGKVTQVGALVQGFCGPVPNVPGAGNNSARSSRGNIDFGLWNGHEVNSEFVDLLDLILKKYPETFEHFTAKSKTLCTMKLNMLCTSVNAFASTPMTEIDTEMITGYRALFSYLQSSFNVNWLLGRLNYIEQLHLSQHELRAVYSCTNEAFGTLGAELAAGAVYIGDSLCLLSDP